MVLYVDGGCRGNNQTDLTQRRMVAVVTNVAGDVLSEREEPGGSNNIAELMAVHDALIWVRNHASAMPADIRTDSRNNLSWVSGKKLGKRLNDRGQVEQLRTAIAWMIGQGVVFSLTWIPREENLAGHYIEAHYGL